MDDKKVFISYAAADRDRVKNAIDRLESPENQEMSFQPEQNVWSAEVDFSSEEPVRHQLQTHIKTASKVVVLWSKNAATSQHVQYELGVADALEKPLTIVQLDKTAPPLPQHLQGHIVDLS